MATLDPSLYGDYKTSVTVSIAGGHMRWESVPGFEYDRIFPIIRDTAALWMNDYDVELEAAADRSWVYLHVRFRRTPDSTDVRDLKGRMDALWIATSWGGGR